MKIAEGDNHLISERDGLVICQVWERPDLTPEQGASNATQIVDFVLNRVLKVGTTCRGLILDVRRGPPSFGPKTRAVMTMVFARAGAVGVPIATLTGPIKHRPSTTSSARVRRGRPGRSPPRPTRSVGWRRPPRSRKAPRDAEARSAFGPVVACETFRAASAVPEKGLVTEGQIALATQPPTLDLAAWLIPPLRQGGWAAFRVGSACQRRRRIPSSSGAA
jgi:hypothetical protein